MELPFFGGGAGVVDVVVFTIVSPQPPSLNPLRAPDGFLRIPGNITCCVSFIYDSCKYIL